MQQAAVAAKARGNLPGALERFARAAVKPRVDWRSVLRRFMQAAARQDYSWRMPNPRFVAHGLYLPALRSEAMGEILVAIDTSGSVDEVMLGQFAAEIQAIADELQPERIRTLYADARVRGEQETERGDGFRLERFPGGGGTDFRPVFRRLEELEIQPVAVVYLTDLDGIFPQEPPAGVPVLWASTDDRPAPFGEVVLCQ